MASCARARVLKPFVVSVAEHLPSSGIQRRPSKEGLSLLGAIEDIRIPETARKFNESLRASFPVGVPPRLLVLGAGGTGKTILGQQLILETCRASLVDVDGSIQFRPSWIPFRIPLSGLVSIVDDKREGWKGVIAYFGEVIGRREHSLLHCSRALCKNSVPARH